MPQIFDVSSGNPARQTRTSGIIYPCTSWDTWMGLIASMSLYISCEQLHQLQLLLPDCVRLWVEWWTDPRAEVWWAVTSRALFVLVWHTTMKSRSWLGNMLARLRSSKCKGHTHYKCCPALWTSHFCDTPTHTHIIVSVQGTQWSRPHVLEITS